MNSEPFIYSKGGFCANCKIKVDAVLHQHLRQNGALGFVWVCSRCNLRDPFRQGLFIANAKVQAVLSSEQIALLPVIRPDALLLRCAKCGSRFADLHHWAPKAIFGAEEAENWPQDYLCDSCHKEWHAKVTPQLIHGNDVAP